jgi:hypothetical protein
MYRRFRPMIRLAALAGSALFVGCGFPGDAKPTAGTNAPRPACAAVPAAEREGSDAVLAMRVNTSGTPDPDGPIVECVFLLPGDPEVITRCPDGREVFGVTRKLVAWVGPNSAVTIKEGPAPVPEGCEP